MNVGVTSSALNSLSAAMLVRANNIANVSTGGFVPQNVTFSSGPRNQGVQIGSIYAGQPEPPLMPGLVPLESEGAVRYAPGLVEGSGTDLANEFVHLSATQRAFEANAAVIRTYDDMSGVLLNVVV